MLMEIVFLIKYMFRYAFITTTLSASTSFMHLNTPILFLGEHHKTCSLPFLSGRTIPCPMHCIGRSGLEFPPKIEDNSSVSTSKFSTIKSIFFIAVILCCKLLLYTLFECRVHFLIQFPDTIHLSIDGSVGYCCTALLVTTVRFQQIVDFSSLRYILCSTNQFNLRQC